MGEAQTERLFKEHYGTIQSTSQTGRAKKDLAEPKIHPYTIFRDGAEIAYVEASSQYVHEEDAEAHQAASKVPVQGFYRIQTDEKNLDLLFVAILAFARSGASDDKGGSIGILKGTIGNH